MDGTAMYECVAPIFLAQINNRPISFVDLIITFVTSSLASICAAGVPSGGLVTMVLVLSTLDIPQEQISIFFAIDWLL
jgi:Na+/H+-dicarboxylate symporter